MAQQFLQACFQKLWIDMLAIKNNSDFKMIE